MEILRCGCRLHWLKKHACAYLITYYCEFCLSCKVHISYIHLMHIIQKFAYHTPSILGTTAMAGVSKPNLPISSVVGSRFTLNSLLSSIYRE